MKHLWLIPAGASLAFFGFSTHVALSHGPFGFLAEHARAGWGHQIAIDLVSACSIALLLGAPHAKRYGVRMLPWIILTLLTGSIGLFAFAARLVYAREAAQATRPGLG